MGRSEIELDLPALAITAGEEMHVHLVGAELGATVADLRQIERLGFMGRTADAKNRAPAKLIMAHKQVDRFRKLRAADQAENGVHVALARDAGPELKPLSRQLLQSLGHRRDDRFGRSDSRQLDDTRTHASNPSGTCHTAVIAGL